MLYEEHFDMIAPHSVGDDVSEISENKFAGAFNLAAPSQESILRQEALCP